MNSTQIRKTALLALFCVLSTLAPYCYESLAAPISQSLKRSSSSINFGVDSPSPSLSMQGSFKDFSGELLLNPTKIESSKIKLSLNLASAQLPPDQLLQAIFLQTALARFKQHSGTFESTSIEKIRDNTYLVTGNYTWMKRTKRTTLPVQIIRASPAVTEIKLLLDGAVQAKDLQPETAQLAPGLQGSKGWAQATLVFVP